MKINKDLIISDSNLSLEDLMPVVLYSNSAGSKTSISNLSDDVENYKYLEIFYGWEQGGFGLLSTKIDVSSIHGIDLSTIVCNNDRIYFANSKWTAAGKQLSLLSGEYWRVAVTAQNAATRTLNNMIAIFKVIGWK